MGVKIKRSGKDVAESLRKRGDRSTRQLRRVHVAAVNKLLEVSRAMAPYREGVLEKGFRIVESREGRRKVLSVVVHAADVPYAIYMHEHRYKLGPGSLAKQGGSEFAVGRKYLSRAKDWIIREWNYYDKCRDAVREGLK